MSISIECLRDLVVVVQDDGVGFDPSEAESGEGLGLVFMSERARALGGVLSVESGVRGGSTVRFELLGVGDATGQDGETIGDERQHRGGFALALRHEGDRAGGHVPVDVPVPSLRVFVAERHPLLRAGLARMIESSPGFRVVGEASTPEEARGQVRRLRPDVVLLDSTLVHGDSDTLVRDLRAEAQGSAVIMMSESSTGREGALAEAGASGFLLKLIDAEELAAAMKAVVSGSAVSTPGASAISARLGALTAHERNVLALMAAGYTNSEIGRTLFLATKTIERQLATVVRKMGARNRAHATALAVARHMVEPPDA